MVVVAHNSGDDLDQSLPALLAQVQSGDEVVVVDNASRDPVSARPGVRVVRLEQNVGFAGGANEGARMTSAPLLFLLNPDAVVQPGCLHALRDAADSFPHWGAWQALVTLAGGDLVNTAGNAAHWTGLGWAGGYGEPTASVGSAREVGFASGAALVVRRDAWNATGGFDPRYFMYVEDLDLSLRLRLAGWSVGVVPAARVEHGYEFAKGDYKWYYLERNRWWTVLSDYPAPLLGLVLPALLALELVLLAVAAHDGWLRAKLLAQAAVLRELPAILHRRRTVQESRRVGTREFAAGFQSTLDSPYLGPAARAPAARAAQRAYWAAVSAGLRCTSD